MRKSDFGALRIYPGRGAGSAPVLLCCRVISHGDVMSSAERRPGVLSLVPDIWGAGSWMPRHQVLTRLSAYFPVTWMDPPEQWRRLWTGTARPRPSETGLPEDSDFQVYRPGRLLPRVFRPTVAARLTEKGRLRAASRLLAQRGAEPAVLYLWRPQFAPVLDLLPDCVSVYHVDDEYSFSTTEQPVDPNEAALLGRASQCIIHSPALWEKKAHLASRAALIPNGVDYTAYATPVAEPADLQSIPHPRIGYIGVIKSQLDMPLLLALAERRPDWSFVLVGRCRPGEDQEAFNALSQLPNVHLLGQRPIAALPSYTQHFDVGLMPYDVNDYTKYIYPLKLHEYLATGLPVVASGIRTLLDFSSVVSIADSVDEWASAIEASLAPGARSPEMVAERRSVARGHDWNVLVARIAALIAERLGSSWPELVAAKAEAEANLQGALS